MQRTCRVLLIFDIIDSRCFSVASDLAKRGIILPKVSKPVGNYVSILRTGNILYLSGALPIKEDGTMYKGKVGDTMDEKTGYEAAKRAAMVLAANALSEVPDISRIRVCKITGFVNSAPSFENIPAVVNGASDALAQIFGENGKHISNNTYRSDLTSRALSRVPVEIEAIMEILA